MKIANIDGGYLHISYILNELRKFNEIFREDVF